MPGILPASPNAPTFGHDSSLPNGSPKYREDIVREIKENAKEIVRTQSHGASTTGLLSQVKTQFQLGRDSDRNGDLKEALSAYAKAASLVTLMIEKADPKKGAKDVRKGIVDFMDNYGTELKRRTVVVEEKLRAIEKEEKEKKLVNGVETNGLPDSTSSGGLPSIADRMQSLRNSGLSITTSKRLSNQVHNSAPSPHTTPPSPISGSPIISTRSSQSTAPLSPSSLTSAPSISSLASALNAPLVATSSTSQHSFVPTSAFGPPSPSSSPSSSPKIANINYISEFNSNFPSIDEIEENVNFALSSVPTGKSTGSTKSTSSRSSKQGTDVPPVSPTPHAALRNFMVPMERPSSTPLTPTTNNFTSRPASPSNAQPKPIPIKPSNLSTSSTSASAAAANGNGNYHPISQSPSFSNGILATKSDIPKKSTATPKELREYMKDHKVLLLDVRDRAEFDKEHVKASGAAAVVCIDPAMLKKEGVTADTLESAMLSTEAATFKNREMWDLVVVYDQSSADVGEKESSLNVLMGAIYTNAFKKFLKRLPMILEGGLDAWKREMGQQEVEGSSDLGIAFLSSGPASASASASASTSAGVNVAAAYHTPPPPSPSIQSPSLSRTASKNPFATGGPLASSRPRRVSVSNTSNNSPPGQPFEFWQPSAASSSGTPTVPGRGRADTNPPIPGSSRIDHKSNYSLDQRSMHSRSPADVGFPSRFTSPESASSALSRRPALSRAALSSSVPLSSQSIDENVNSPPSSPQINGASPITYPSFSRSSGHSAAASTSSFTPAHFDITSPPQASLNPPLSRRRSDYIDQSQEALSGLHRAPIEYPELPSQHTIRPPPAVASPALERQENRPWINQGYTSPPLPSTVPASGNLTAPTPPRINSDWPVRYWSDVSIGMSGLKNLGNTCYMNAPIQCLSASPPFARFFTEGRWKNAVNHVNPLGTKGRLTAAFAQIVHAMWGSELPYQTPTEFRKTICSLNSQYIGSDQHDSQEFLSFLLDGIHEDLNRILQRPTWNRTPEEEAELERLPPQIASEQEWRAWKARNDSIIVDYFQGQFRNQMKCLTCHKTSTTYNTFSILSVPIPHGRSGKVALQRCLDAFFNMEVMEKDDAWDCPRCKAKQRASKQLSLARLPPILVIHLKRFEANGRFSDKIDTFVDFPIKSLDLTSYMPPPLPVGADRGQSHGSPDDPRTQLPPYKYDLYGVTNHVGNLSSGHYTAFVGSRGGWMYCDDSVIKPVDSKQVVSQKAYFLFYKRTKA